MEVPSHGISFLGLTWIKPTQIVEEKAGSLVASLEAVQHSLKLTRTEHKFSESAYLENDNKSWPH